VTTVVRIVAVGDELLEGRTADTNSLRIQRALGEHAVQVAGVRVVPDRFDAVAEALDWTGDGDLVFVTGGLGSTPDDLTRDAVAAWAGVPLREDAAVRAQLEERWRARGIRAPRAGVERQCQVPAGLEPLTNPVGSAPGLVGPLRGRTLVLLPGVPAELAGLLPLAVARLGALGVLPTARPTRLWRTAQVAELALVQRCAEVRSAFPDLSWSWWLTEWGVDVRLAADAAGSAVLDRAAAAVEEALAPVTYSRTRESLPQVVQRLMIARGATLATAESCTAGLIAGALTDAPGSSAFFRGGIIAYHDAVKVRRLGVSPELLAAGGAVSEATVRAMAAGARAAVDADYAVAVSGIAGPDGGSEEKPVGTTWIGVATPTAVFARRYRFSADRERNRLLTVAVAIDSLRRVLEHGDAASPWRDDDTWSRP